MLAEEIWARKGILVHAACSRMKLVFPVLLAVLTTFADQTSTTVGGGDRMK
jgi:hypothetical protein